jgi:ArsR family transcriptional regulator, arsenate/arsenite/antimonite-responsive transcriptional repressor
LRRVADWFGMALASYVYVKANILVRDISVKAYIGVMSRSAKTFDMVRLFAALADRTRLRLLNLMDGREVCVCYFVEILKQGQPKISRHLAYLRNAGIVRTRREGKWMHYSIERPGDKRANAVLDATLLSLKSDRETQSDLARLGKACCEPQRFVSLQGAPVPAELEARR